MSDLLAYVRLGTLGPCNERLGHAQMSGKNRQRSSDMKMATMGSQLSCPHCGAKFGRLMQRWQSPRPCPRCQQPIEVAFCARVFFPSLVALVVLFYGIDRLVDEALTHALFARAPILALSVGSYWRKAK